MAEYKLKDLTSLDLKQGEKREVEIEGLDNAKVLLVKAGDKVAAVTPKCTHYGAPLVKGVLTPEGRLTCPWHGACFSVHTGDVEDAPALDPLGKFDLKEKDGGVYVSGPDEWLKSSFRSLKLQCKPSVSEKVVIVGGGSGTLGATEALRAGGFKGPVTVITREGYAPIDRTKLSKALIADLSKIQWRSDDFYKEAGIDVIHDEVTKVDVDGKSVSTQSGKSYDYTKLILATGGDTRWLPLDGLKNDLGNVFVLRTLHDVKKILEACGDHGKKIVVIGSSFIGMEVGNCLQGKKNNVTVVGMEAEPLERVMGPEVGSIFRSLLEKNGVKFHLNASVDKATPSDSDSSKVGAVHLKDGTKLEADIVIEGVGVSPATKFLQGSKIQLEKDGSIRVNESFEVEGAKDVFAIGDIATYPYWGPGGNGAPVRIEHWNVAQNAGRTAAHAIIEPGTKPKAFIPVFWSALGAGLRYCGNTMPQGYDDVVLQGETSAQEPKWIAFFTKGETVVAFASMNKDPYMTKAAELMRRNGMPSKSEIQNGKDILDVEIPSKIAI